MNVSSTVSKDIIMNMGEKRSLSEKVALITGSDARIGAATAVAFARRGAMLSLTGKDPENLRKIGARCSAESPLIQQPLLIPADISNEKDIEKILTTTIENYSRLDILVNNASMASIATIGNVSLKQFDEVFAVNVRAPFYLTMLAVPYLVKSKGCIVNVSSVAGIRPIPTCVTYSMSKCAMDHLTRCVASNLGPQGVRVNSVNPGSVPTSVYRTGSKKQGRHEKGSEAMYDRLALRRMGKAEEVAEAIAFLASDKASFITGVTLPVDGGHLVVAP